MIDKGAERNGLSDGSRMFKVAISAMQGRTSRTSHLFQDGKATLEAHWPETSGTVHAASTKSDYSMNSFQISSRGCSVYLMIKI